MSTNLAKRIVSLGLEDARDALMAMSKPSIELHTSQSPITPGCSKFGGTPDLPSSFHCPRHDLGDYRFIGQINLSEIPRGAGPFAESGLLSFFYVHDENGEVFWGDPGFVRAFRFDIASDIQPF